MLLKCFVLLLIVGQLLAGTCLDSLRKLICDDYHEYQKPDCYNSSKVRLVQLGRKFYYFELLSTLNWYKAFEFCRLHGMFLATISSKEENDYLINYITDIGYSLDYFWVSGTDLGWEGKFFWMSNGQPMTFTDWSATNPDNAAHGTETENCVHYWNPTGNLIQWNDLVCSSEHYFICQTKGY